MMNGISVGMIGIGWIKGREIRVLMNKVFFGCGWGGIGWMNLEVRRGWGIGGGIEGRGIVIGGGINGGIRIIGFWIKINGG